MPSKKTWLKDLMVDEVSFVDKGANPEAHILIYKRIEKKTKTEDGKEFPASDFAYVPDPEMPSEWKLRLTSVPGGEPDPAIVGAAAAALGPGFRGQKVDLPASEREAVVARVRQAWAKANPNKDKDQMPEALMAKAEHLEEGMSQELLDKVAKLEAQSALNAIIIKAALSLSSASSKEQFDAIETELSKVQGEDAKNEQIVALKSQIAAGRETLAKSISKAAHEEFSSKLPASLKKAFADMSGEEKEAFIKSYGKTEGTEQTVLAKAVKELTAANETMAKRIAQLDRKEKVEALVKGDLAGVQNAAELAEHVIKLQEVDSEAAASMVKTIKAQAEQLKAAGIFGEIGKGGAGDTQSATEKLDKMAKDLQSKDTKLSFQQAYAKVLQENPELYNASLKESK